MNNGSTKTILGYRVWVDGTEACVTSIVEAVQRQERLRWLACLNPHSYAMALKSPAFSDALRSAEWLVPDGVGIVVALRLLGDTTGSRTTGSDVFHGVNERLARGGGARVFFIGSTEQTLRAISEKLPRDYPGLIVAGTYSPPFKPEYSSKEMDAMVEAINASRCDVLWVGLSAPKQEMWIHRVCERVDVPFAGAIGAVFDFYTNQTSRGSPTLQRVGLEWLVRLTQEPRRLWRRTLVSAPVFVWHVAREVARRWRRRIVRSTST